MIEAGLRLELIDTLPPDIGETLVKALQESLASGDQKQVCAALKHVGDTIHAYWGSDLPTTARFEPESTRYATGLSTQTAGTRLFINLGEHSAYPKDLIFPNIHLGHKGRDGMTLAQAFEAVFGTLAENIHAGQGEQTSPYYRVKIGSQPKTDAQ